MSKKVKHIQSFIYMWFSRQSAVEKNHAAKVKPIQFDFMSADQ